MPDEFKTCGKNCHLRLQVLTVASMKIIAFWDVASSSLVEVDRRFRGAYFNIRAMNRRRMEAVSSSETVTTGLSHHPRTCSEGLDGTTK
jgi:hypothetical protein